MQVIEEAPITKEEVAKMFGKDVRTIERWMRDGVLPYIKLGGKKQSPVYFSRAKIFEHLNARYAH